MFFVETYSGFSLWKLTRPVKLIFGMIVMFSGSLLAAQDILIG